MHKIAVFDVETRSANPDVLEVFKPEFTAPGNLKDPEKIRVAIAEKEREWRESAALSALTGEIVVIGWLCGGETKFITGMDSEKALLEDFWHLVKDHIRSGGRIVGFNCHSFDWPYAIRRSFAHRVHVPMDVRQGRYFSDALVDIMDSWTCGSRDPRDRISLDNLSKFLGVGKKNGEGKEFGHLWETDREKALAYLANDLQLTKACYEAIHEVA